MTAAQLGEALGVHVTTARYHLDRLVGAGLIRSESVRAGRRGRPTLHYSLVDADAARQELIAVLANAVSRGDGPDRVAAAGAAWADSIRMERGDAVDALVHEFARLGFDPQTTEDGVDLHDCPFREAARAAPGVVCGVHGGLAQRIVERASDGEAQATLQPFVTDQLCRISILSSS